MELTEKNIIESRLSEDGCPIFNEENPATGEMLEPGFYEASEKQIHEAIEKANNSFQEYHNKRSKEKAEFLEAIAEEIFASCNILITLGIEESGLPEARLTGERRRTVGQLKLFAQVLQEPHQ